MSKKKSGGNGLIKLLIGGGILYGGYKLLSKPSLPNQASASAPVTISTTAKEGGSTAPAKTTIPTTAQIAGQVAIIKGSNVNVRDDDSTSANILTTGNNGEIVGTATGTVSNGFYEIQPPKDSNGFTPALVYVYASYVTLVNVNSVSSSASYVNIPSTSSDTAPAYGEIAGQTVVINGDGVSILNAPTTNGSVVATGNDGDVAGTATGVASNGYYGVMPPNNSDGTAPLPVYIPVGSVNLVSVNPASVASMPTVDYSSYLSGLGTTTANFYIDKPLDLSMIGGVASDGANQSIWQPGDMQSVELDDNGNAIMSYHVGVFNGNSGWLWGDMQVSVPVSQYGHTTPLNGMGAPHGHAGHGDGRGNHGGGYPVYTEVIQEDSCAGYYNAQGECIY